MSRKKVRLEESSSDEANNSDQDVIFFSDDSEGKNILDDQDKEEAQELKESMRRRQIAKAKLANDQESKDDILPNDSDQDDDDDLADEQLDFSTVTIGRANSHTSGSPTGVAICKYIDEKKKTSLIWQVYSTWSDGWLRRFDLTHKRTVWKRHCGSRICSIACNDQYVAVGLQNGQIKIFSVLTNKEAQIQVLHSLLHKDAVSAVCFGAEGNRLYSGSIDLTVKVWQIECTYKEEGDERQEQRLVCSYLDTLHGHQDGVLSLSSSTLANDRVLSVGSRDRTARLWKILDETQLIFRASAEPDGDSLTTVQMVDSSHFVTGGYPRTDGLSLWHHGRKKPIFRTGDQFACSYLSRVGSLIFACAEDKLVVRVYRYLVGEQRLAFLHELSIYPHDVLRKGIITGLHARHDIQHHCLLISVSVGREARLDRAIISVNNDDNNHRCVPQVHLFSIPLMIDSDNIN